MLKLYQTTLVSQRQSKEDIILEDNASLFNESRLLSTLGSSFNFFIFRKDIWLTLLAYFEHLGCARGQLSLLEMAYKLTINVWMKLVTCCLEIHFNLVLICSALCHSNLYPLYFSEIQNENSKESSVLTTSTLGLTLTTIFIYVRFISINILTNLSINRLIETINFPQENQQFYLRIFY